MVHVSRGFLTPLAEVLYLVRKDGDSLHSIRILVLWRPILETEAAPWIMLSREGCARQAWKIP